MPHKMPRLIVVVAGLALAVGSLHSAFAQGFKRSCEDVCLNRCATKELAPGLYRASVKLSARNSAIGTVLKNLRDQGNN
jgi:hypothetical protein